MKTFLRVFTRPVWTPEADESRYLNTLVVATFLILPLWGRGYVNFMGPNPVLVINVAAWLVYLTVYGKRLRRRGELGRMILGPTVFFGLLLGVCWW